MTKQEKQKYNQELGQIWMEIRAYKNATKMRIAIDTNLKGIQTKYQGYIANNEELCQAIELAYPKLIDQIKELKYPNDIEKAIACLNAIIPTDS
jgi:hypothetical protein